MCSACREKTENPSEKRDSSSATEAVKVSFKKTQSFVPYSKAIRHSFKSLSAKKQKKLSPMLFATLGEVQNIFSSRAKLNFYPASAVLWEYQKQNKGSLPSSEGDVSTLKTISNGLLPKHDIDPSLLPHEVLE
jgi:hypothetical protein